jgi:hypothetical protein
MQFLFPVFLTALAVLAIPIIIHLFHFRRFKRVYFTNVRFLKEVKEETSSRSRLRNLLVLLARLLALAALVLAFAQPYLKQSGDVQKGSKAVSIFIDNSFSMDALSQDVPLLDKAKQRAREIIAAYQENDRFQVLTMDFEGRHQRLVSKEDALALVDEIERSPSVQPMSNILTRQKQVLNTGTEENKVVYQISDFQKTIVDLQNYTDTLYEVNLVPLQSVQERNISIDSAWFEAPIQMVNQNNPLIVQVKNNSTETAENIRLSVKYEGQSKPVGTLTIPAESFVRDTVNINISRTGWHEAELNITDYPVQFDDQYYASFYVAEEVNTLSINEDVPNRFLNAAIGGLEYFEIDNQNRQQLDYSSFPQYELIILNDLSNISSGLATSLRDYVNAGGNLLVFPGRNAQAGNYNTFLSSFPANGPEAFEMVERTVSEINTQEFIFQDVFDNKTANLKLPLTQGNYRFARNAARSERILLTYRDGNSYLSAYNIGEGNLYVCAAPLDDGYNDLVRNGGVFVPMIYKMALTGGNRKPIAYTIGRDVVIEAVNTGGTGERVYKLRGNEEEFIPQQRIVGAKVFMSLDQSMGEAGYYDLYLEPGEVLEQYAFNFNRQESDLTYFSTAELAGFVGPNMNIIDVQGNAVLTATIEERSQGVVLWRWCLIFALIFLGVEVLLLRFWKT